ncbi:unnamed protein product [Bursaphelenchus xylophilus]|uniref:Innexin n=1 Tax=Bursaphelenchus xylophilus TaxID=6326 RepID=A0A1I7RVC3_BURXY|nr:unnamed protein product [Bursaphelenchus xylophilus]CAG9086668.1 unnamed protein product [Bursaphelenchus xylophilus]
MNLLGNFLTTIKPRLDDTVIDRLNYYYSTLIITVMAITLTARQYVGQPLQCWVPAEFSKAWEQYAENYCFVYNTYWVSPEEDIPNQVDERVRRQLLYYQWVPFIMALQAGCFYLPVIFYSKVNKSSGVDVTDIIKSLNDVDKAEKTERAKAVNAITAIIEESLRLMFVRRQNAGKHWRASMKYGLLSGTYLTNVYTTTKLLYLVNLVGQFIMMNQFLGQDNHLWGFNILHDITMGRDWELSGNFPRVALCDFTVRTLANVQRFSIQCVLMLNMFNEKIFLFLYWWLVFVFFLSLHDTAQWQLLLRWPNHRTQYVKRFIRPEMEFKLLLREFCERVVHPDVVFVLEMISLQANELYTQEVIQALWKEYQTNAQLQDIVTKLDFRRKTLLLTQPSKASDSGHLSEVEESGEEAEDEGENDASSSIQFQSN